MVKLKQIINIHKKSHLRNIDNSSWCVYIYECAGCKKTYIGSTTRHLIARINEHEKDYIHQHHITCNQSNALKSFFTVVANNIRNKRKLLIAEAIHIKTEKPYMNTLHTAIDTYHTHILKT